ncbi:MAG: insulinase family protein [Rikenellaceae bacterium]
MRYLGSVLSLLVAILGFGSYVTASANEDVGFVADIARDSALRYGVLDNSLTYYIRHNARPKGQADFYIVSDVGSIQEADDQQGLAHFMEHMAFNGTKNLPGKQIINYLECNGVKFGANLNAYTSWDVTVYMMKDVPVSRQPVVDSLLLILHDWAGFIEPQVEEIDKERGVIKEELRTRDNADWRSTMALIGALGRETRYAERNIIGHLDYLESFEPEVLLRFYEEWYRPDYQAIIIVGDVDVDAVERQVKKLFSELKPAAVDAPQKEVVRVVDSKELFVEIFADPEMQSSSVQYYITFDAPSKEELATVDAARLSVENSLIRLMQNERIAEVVLGKDSPILGGSMSHGRVGVIPTLSATAYSGESVEGGLESGLAEVVTQMERTRRYGFSQGEFERAKSNLLRSSKRQYLNSGDRTNNSFINGYISNYRFGAAVPSAEDRWKIDSALISRATLADVNRRVGEIFRDDNHLLFVTSPLKDGLEIPTEKRLRQVVDSVRVADVGRYVDKEVGASLLSEAQVARIDAISGGAEAVAVVSESRNKMLESVEWRLSNGIDVVVKPTKLRADEVVLSISTDGGASLISDEDYFAASMLLYFMGRAGVADYSAIELSRQLSGRIATLRTSVSDYSHGFEGGSSPNDLETLMQLVYLRFMEPRFDESDLENLKRALRSRIENQMSDPDYVVGVRFDEVAYDNNSRMGAMTVEMIDNLQISALERVWDKLYRDADNFRFTFVGNVDVAKLQPLVERYLGALNVCPYNVEMNYQEDGIRPVKGVVSDRFELKMEQPKAAVRMLISGESLGYSMKNYVTSIYLKMALDNLLLENVREEMGGTYGVRTGLSLARRPYENYKLSISYDTNAEMVEDMQRAVLAQLETIAEVGVSQEQIGKSREYLLKSYGNMLERNSGWLSVINGYYSKAKLDYLSDYEKIVKAMQSKDIQKMAAKILKEGNLVEVIMIPEKE